MTLFGSVFVVLVLLAFALTLVSGITARVPLWVPVLLITIALLIQGLPVNGR